jgi:hypothetical protein
MRYAANLLFEYGVDERRRALPLCEKRIVVLAANQAALRLLQDGR